MSYDPYAPRSAGRGRGGRNSAPSHHGGYGRGGLGRRSTTEPITMMGRGSLPPTPAEVLTNLFPVQHFGNPAVTAGYQWYQYRLSVTPLKGRIKHQDEQAGTWKETMVDANPIKIERMKQTLEEKGSTERTRALFSKLSDELWETYNILLAVRPFAVALHPFAVALHLPPTSNDVMVPVMHSLLDCSCVFSNPNRQIRRRWACPTRRYRCQRTKRVCS
jgi:hypothetical protein